MNYTIIIGILLITIFIYTYFTGTKTREDFTDISLMNHMDDVDI